MRFEDVRPEGGHFVEKPRDFASKWSRPEGTIAEVLMNGWVNDTISIEGIRDTAHDIDERVEANGDQVEAFCFVDNSRLVYHTDEDGGSMAYGVHATLLQAAQGWINAHWADMKGVEDLEIPDARFLSTRVAILLLHDPEAILAGKEKVWRCDACY